MTYQEWLSAVRAGSLVFGLVLAFFLTFGLIGFLIDLWRDWLRRRGYDVDWMD